MEYGDWKRRNNELIFLYLNPNLSIDEISKHFETSRSAIHVQANKIGLKRPKEIQLNNGKKHIKFLLEHTRKNGVWNKDRHEMKICMNCKKRFNVHFYKLKQNKGIFCSRECYDILRHNPEIPELKKQRGTRQYKEWKKTILYRDNFTCQKCGSKENLEVDHIKSFVAYPNLRYDINNGRVLCSFCHNKTKKGGHHAYLSKV